MQTPKTSVKSSSEGGRRIISPRSVSSDTTQRLSGRVVRQIKTTGLESGSCTTQPSVRTPKAAGARIIDLASPKGPVTELQKKRLGRIAELESQVNQLEDALTTVKDQLIVSELWKKQAKVDAEESRKQLLAITLRLEESEKLLAQCSSGETHVVQELEDKHDDEVWKCKLENIQKPKSTDSAALTDALLEIDQLKVKLDTISQSEATKTKQAESAYEEINILKSNMAEKLSLIEEMKNQLEDSKSSESRAQVFANETLLQLETAKKTMESLQLTSHEYNTIVLELDQSRARVSLLEGIIDIMKTKERESESQEISKLKAELAVREEQSRQALETADELRKSKADVEELKANLMDKETELQCIVEENEDLNAKLANLISSERENESKHDFDSLKLELTNLETELGRKSDENEKMKIEIEKMNGVMEESKHEFKNLNSKLTNLETELRKQSDENEKLTSLNSKLPNLDAELREKSDENEKLKLEIKNMKELMEATKKRNEEVAEMSEKLEAVKMSNSETEEELRRVKLQMSQWRKAAEAATTMLCDENGDNNGRMLVDRAWSMGNYSPRKRMNIGSPRSVDIADDDNDYDDEFLKRKNGNMLKRIGVLWKKPHNK